MIHNPNMIEETETTKVLLDVLLQANAGKVEKALKELSDCDVKKYVKTEELVDGGIERVYTFAKSYQNSYSIN